MESNAKNVVIREFVLEAVQSALAKAAARKISVGGADEKQPGAGIRFG